MPRFRIGRRTWLIAIAGAFVLFALSPVVVDALHTRSARRRALLVHVGDSKEDVRRILGEPDGTFARGSGLFSGSIIAGFRASPESWYWGSMFDWGNCFQNEFPYFFPVRIRLFGPDSDDVAVSFDDKGKVVQVDVPESD
jgi:hypothetical protein